MKMCERIVEYMDDEKKQEFLDIVNDVFVGTLSKIYLSKKKVDREFLTSMLEHASTQAVCMVLGDVFDVNTDGCEFRYDFKIDGVEVESKAGFRDKKQLIVSNSVGKEPSYLKSIFHTGSADKTPLHMFMKFNLVEVDTSTILKTGVIFDSFFMMFLEMDTEEARANGVYWDNDPGGKISIALNFPIDSYNWLMENAYIINGYLKVPSETKAHKLVLEPTMPGEDGKTYDLTYRNYIKYNTKITKDKYYVEFIMSEKFMNDNEFNIGDKLVMFMNKEEKNIIGFKKENRVGARKITNKNGRNVVKFQVTNDDMNKHFNKTELREFINGRPDSIIDDVTIINFN